jgi:hypothetical protein
VTGDIFVKANELIKIIGISYFSAVPHNSFSPSRGEGQDEG